MTEKRNPFTSGKSVETSLLINALKGANVGDEKADSELTKICGRDTSTGGSGYANLASAIEHIQKEHGITWERIRGQNKIRCANAHEKIGIVSRRIRRIRNHAKRGGRILTSVDLSELSDDESRHAVAQGAQIGAIMQFTSAKSFKKLSQGPKPKTLLLDELAVSALESFKEKNV